MQLEPRIRGLRAGKISGCPRQLLAAVSTAMNFRCDGLGPMTSRTPPTGSKPTAQSQQKPNPATLTAAPKQSPRGRKQDSRSNCQHQGKEISASLLGPGTRCSKPCVAGASADSFRCPELAVSSERLGKGVSRKQGWDL